MMCEDTLGKNMKRLMVSSVLVAGLLNMSACGYFLYPERVGQASGKIDPTVVILDAAGLIIGVLPGVVAFAVDLTTGAIYLSPGEKSAIDKHGTRNKVTENLQPINDDDLEVDKEATAKALSQLIGRSVDASHIQYFKD
jgi:hypothetical protein